VVTNYQTGEILAMVSKPDYDPYEAGTDTVEDTAYLNRCLQGLYTPGSVFKIVTLAAALEHDPNVLHQSFICSGSWHYENGSIVCAGQTAHGTIDLKTALEKSCNVTFGKLAYQLGLDRLLDTAHRLGFNENFKFGEFTMYNSQFPESQANMSDLVWAGIGQGTVQVTPLHMAMITGAVANDGLMMKPRLVQSITASTGIVKQTGGSEPFRQVMSPATAQVIGEYMLGAVRSGTAKRAAIDGLRVCGKTGSAESSRNGRDVTHGLFIGYIDSEELPYAVCVLVEEIIDGEGGGSTAAPIAGEIFRSIRDNAQRIK
jgi:peptidoglycan glycosyltransferase